VGDSIAARGLAAQVEIVDGGAQFEECRALAAGQLESHATSGAGTGSAHGSRVCGYVRLLTISATGADLAF
jgi:hypothetical protein